jgi:RNA polymerase sigma-70 factor (ECF subfamily)
MGTDFEQLISRVRAGDADAAVALVRQYESAVRVAVRARLFDPALRRQFDSIDVCQSVLASFFLRVAAGQFDLQQPKQLVALLTKMAHNKIAQQIRYHHQKRRDIRRKDVDTEAAVLVCRGGFDPARQIQAKELLERVWQSMDSELRAIASRRFEGQSWAEIAQALGGTAGARRKQFERGLNQIAGRLGIDEAINDVPRQLA